MYLYAWSDSARSINVAEDMAKEAACLIIIEFIILEMKKYE